MKVVQTFGAPGEITVLEGIAGTAVGRLERLDPDREYTLGRGPEARIRLDDKRASRVHARLAFEPGRLLVEDLDSNNGTYVNGTRIRRQYLKPGDTLQVGDSAFRVGLLPPPEPPPPPDAPTEMSLPHRGQGPRCVPPCLQGPGTPERVYAALQYISQHRLSGALVIRGTAGTHRIRTYQGRIHDASLEQSPGIPREKALRRLLRQHGETLYFEVETPAQMEPPMAEELEKLWEAELECAQLLGRLEGLMQGLDANIRITAPLNLTFATLEVKEAEILHLTGETGRLQVILDRFSGTDRQAIHHLIELARQGRIDFEH